MSNSGYEIGIECVVARFSPRRARSRDAIKRRQRPVCKTSRTGAFSRSGSFHWQTRLCFCKLGPVFLLLASLSLSRPRGKYKRGAPVSSIKQLTAVREASKKKRRRRRGGEVKEKRKEEDWRHFTDTEQGGHKCLGMMWKSYKHNEINSTSVMYQRLDFSFLSLC